MMFDEVKGEEVHEAIDPTINILAQKAPRTLVATPALLSAIDETGSLWYRIESSAALHGRSVVCDYACSTDTEAQCACRTAAAASPKSRRGRTAARRSQYVAEVCSSQREEVAGGLPKPAQTVNTVPILFARQWHAAVQLLRTRVCLVYRWTP